ncbi:MAG: hypothetical protein AAF959_27385 [Cyanobacteria bacterium P01_D01_bin.56]
MAVIINDTPRKVRIVGYRMDGLRFHQWDPEIYPKSARYINSDNYGDSKKYLVVAYHAGSNPPPKLGVGSAAQGLESGVITLNIPGIQPGISVSKSNTFFYSENVASAEVKPHDLWKLVEDRHGRFGLEKCRPGTCSYNRKKLRGW